MILLCMTLGAGAAQARAPCAMPAELVTPASPMPNVAAAMTRHRPVEVLAIGSGSTVGESGGSSGPAFAANTPGASFPYRMIGSLQEMRPQDPFHLTVKGGRNLSAEAMLPVLRDELAGHHYDLVLWQTGTVEAVRGTRPDSLSGVLQEGVEAAHDKHADVILIEPQFSRFLRANVDLSPYQAVMRQIAGSSGANLFHRFDLTQQWANDDQVDVEHAPHDRRDAEIGTLNACLGQALARFVLAGAAEH